MTQRPRHTEGELARRPPLPLLSIIEKYGDPEVKPCYDCDGTKQDECWITGWVDNYAADELLHGTVSVEVSVRPEWDGDSCSLHVGGDGEGS